MRVPLEWLKEFAPIRLAPKALAERLTMAGLEVTGVHDGEGGPVLELEITPNRADCLSIIGIAREVAALTGQRLKTPGQGTRDKGNAGKATSRPVSRFPFPVIRIEDRKGCARYVGRLIEGVTVKPSPAWMQRRLIACGLRPINTIVDITNYVLLEYGQPLHAFDFDRLADGTILVRRARTGERITTLDGINRTLSAEMLVIADARQAVAVAGIMGGVGSEVTPQTKRVLLESAQFDPVTVRRTARALGLVSESSYRFERGVDPGGVGTASARAAQLITELAGGTLRAVRDVGRQPPRPSVITLQTERLNRWLGTRLAPLDIRMALARLSCRVASRGDSGTLVVTVPSFRRDLTQEADLAEEVARLTGYDAIPATRPVATLPRPLLDEESAYQRLQSLRGLCASLGLTEAVTWALVSEQDLARCGYPAAEAVRLLNPLSQEHAFLRPSLFMGLLQAVRRNLAQGASGVAFFELGAVTERRSLPAQPQRLAMALSGEWLRDWHTRASADFYRLKGLVDALTLRVGGATTQAVSDTQPWAEAGSGVVLRLGGRAVGVAGLVARRIAEAADIPSDVWYAELAADHLVAPSHREAAVEAPPVYPPAKRDLSVVVSDRIPYADVAQVIREVCGPLADRIELVDRYVGPQVPAGHHSLTFAIQYRDRRRTLTAAEVDAVHQRLGQALVNRFGATLR